MALTDSSVKDNANSIQDTVKATVDNLRQMYDQMLQANQEAFGQIAEGTRIQNALQWGAVPRPKDILADLRDQITRFRKWRSELEQLSGRGVPCALLQQLEQAGPQAEPLLRGILS